VVLPAPPPTPVPAVLPPFPLTEPPDAVPAVVPPLPAVTLPALPPFIVPAMPARPEPDASAGVSVEEQPSATESSNVERT